MKTTFSIGEKWESVLCYAGGWITGLIFLLLERDNKVVRFHALQSFVFFAAATILLKVLSILHIVPILGGLFLSGVSFIFFVAYVFLLVQAYQGKMFRIPMIGDVAYNQVFKD